MVSVIMTAKLLCEGGRWEEGSCQERGQQHREEPGTCEGDLGEGAWPLSHWWLQEELEASISWASGICQLVSLH